ncbi:helix-turn-helix domain-containing protein [Tessaracoccus sp. Y36]
MLTTSAQLYTIEQVKESLAIGKTRIYQLIQNGELERVKIGSSTRIPRSSLENYVEKLRGS